MFVDKLITFGTLLNPIAEARVPRSEVTELAQDAGHEQLDPAAGCDSSTETT
jgi:hypothetical protein